MPKGGKKHLIFHVAKIQKIFQSLQFWIDNQIDGILFWKTLQKMSFPKKYNSLSNGDLRTKTPEMLKNNRVVLRIV